MQAAIITLALGPVSEMAISVQKKTEGLVAFLSIFSDLCVGMCRACLCVRACCKLPACPVSSTDEAKQPRSHTAQGTGALPERSINSFQTGAEVNMCVIDNSELCEVLC